MVEIYVCNQPMQLHSSQEITFFVTVFDKSFASALKLEKNI